MNADWISADTCTLSRRAKENRRIHWLDMELAFAGKDLMILVVYRHYIDFGIAVKVIQPIGPYTGWRKWNFPVSAQVRKNGPADILISKGYKLLFKIFFDLVHDEPRELSNSSSPLYG